MSRGRLGPPCHKSDLYTNMSALVAAKSPGFKSEIRLASIVGGWSGRPRSDPRPKASRRGRRREFYSSAAARARCGHAEIFRTIHFRCLHYVAFAYRPFEWLFHRSGNYSHGALPDGSNFFSPAAFLRASREIRRRDYGCTFATSYVRFHEIAVRHQYDEWKQICIFQKTPDGFGILMKLNELVSISLPPPISEFKAYFPIFVLSLFHFYLLDLYVKFLHDYIHFAKFWKILGWS